MRDVDSRLEEIISLYNFHLYHLADKKVNDLYEDYTQNKVELNVYQLEMMFNMIDKISIALYC